VGRRTKCYQQNINNSIFYKEIIAILQFDFKKNQIGFETNLFYSPK